MKDHYKILGVKETATEDEIRERWIELMRKHHPDRTGRDDSDDLRSREINEAYETLKFSSSRAKYDLERAYQRRKRRVRLRGALLRRSYLLLIPLIFGLIYLSIGGDIGRPPGKSESRSDRQSSIVNHPSDSVRTERKEPPRQAAGAGREEEENVRFNGRKFSRLMPFVGVGEAISREAEKKVPQEKPLRQGVSSKEATQDEARDTLRLVPTDIPTEKPAAEAPRDTPTAGVKEVTHQREATAGPSRQAGKPADDRLAREEEIDRFFENYQARYVEMDIDGFLRFFSPGAVQNKRDDFNEIRRIYTRFFGLSQRLLYRLSNLRADIFPDRAQVRASYEIEQWATAGGTRLWKGKVEWTLIREGGELKISAIQYQHDRSP